MPACIVCFRTWASIVNIVGGACVALGIVVIDEISRVIRMSSAPFSSLISAVPWVYAQMSRMLATSS